MCGAFPELRASTSAMTPRPRRSGQSEVLARAADANPGVFEHARDRLGLAHRHGDRGGVDRLMDEMVQANPSPRGFLLAATTYGTLGESEKAATWRRRAEAAKRQPAAP